MLHFLYVLNFFQKNIYNNITGGAGLSLFVDLFLFAFEKQKPIVF